MWRDFNGKEQALNFAEFRQEGIDRDHTYHVDLSKFDLLFGCGAAFVARPGQVMNPFGSQPDVRGADLSEVLDQILAAELEHGS